MEQIKLITDHTLEGLEFQINEFMSTLDEHTDIIDVEIDPEYIDHPFKVFRDRLLAIIRYRIYKEQVDGVATQSVLDNHE